MLSLVAFKIKSSRRKKKLFHFFLFSSSQKSTRNTSYGIEVLKARGKLKRSLKSNAFLRNLYIAIAYVTLVVRVSRGCFRKVKAIARLEESGRVVKERVVVFYKSETRDLVALFPVIIHLNQFPRTRDANRLGFIYRAPFFGTRIRARPFDVASL